MRSPATAWIRRSACSIALLVIPSVPSHAYQAPAAAPLPPQARAAPITDASYSPRLGAYYTLAPYGASLAARIVSPPVPGSPLNQAQAQLEAGDTITALDNLPINGPADLENHYDQTSVTFINVRTGVLEIRWITLPPLGGNPSPYPMPGRRILGVTGVTDVLPIVGIGGPAGYPGLRITSVVPGSAAQAAGLAPGEIISAINGTRITSMDDLRAAVAASGPSCTVQVYNAYGAPRATVAYLGGYPVGVSVAPAAAPTAAPPIAAPVGIDPVPGVLPDSLPVPGLPAPAAPAPSAAPPTS